MPFEKIEGKRETEIKRRVSQRHILPKAVKLRNSEIYQLGPQTIIIYDKDSQTVLQIDQDNNRLEFGGDDWYIDYLTGDAVFNSVSATGSVGEYWLQLSPQWQFALNTAYVAVDGSLVQVNFDDLADKDVYFEVTAKTDAGTGYYKLYNVTDTADIAGTELSTASTSPVILRSSALTIPTGTKELSVYYKCDGGDGVTEYVNCIVAKLVIR